MPSWVEEQISVLIELGDSPQDAEAAVKEGLSWIPDDVDPDDWWPDEYRVMALAGVSETDIADARRDWYENHPGEWARFLDAVAV